jgi:hypothetical protein
MTAVARDWVFSMGLPALRSLSGCFGGTFPGEAAIGDERLYVGPLVHYRDETDISGLVAPGGQSTINNPPTVRRHPVGDFDREQVTLCMTSGIPLLAPSVLVGR